MPHTKQSLKSFRKRAPPVSRIPLAFEWMMGMVGSLLFTGMWESALVMLLCFDTYLRCGEALAMRCKDLLAPSSDVAMRCWTVIVSPGGEGSSGVTKVGAQDDTLRLSMFDFFLCGLSALALAE